MAYTQEHALKAIVKSGGNITLIASRMGCNRQTVYDLAERFPDVKKALTDEKESLKDMAESKLQQQIMKGNMTAIIFYLKTQGRDRGYIEKLVIEGNLNITLINETVKALTEAGLDPSEVFEKLIQRARVER